MTEPLAYLVYGKPAVAHGAESAFDILLMSDVLTPTQGKVYHQLVPVDAFPNGSASYAVMRVDPDYFVVAHAQDPNRQTKFVYVRVPSAQIQRLQGDLTPLVQLFNLPLNDTLALPPPIVWTTEGRMNAIRIALDLVGGEMAHLLTVLDGALYSEGLWIRGFEGDLTYRLRLLQGLALLLPQPFRYYLTFSTHAHRVPPNRPRVIFSELDAPSTRYTLTWGNWNALPSVPADSAGVAFATHLRMLWQGDLAQFVSQLNVLDHIAEHAHPLDVGLAKNVDTIAIRHAIDLALTNPNTRVTIADLMQNLTGDAPPESDLYESYVTRLLQLSLEQRDTESALWLARVMDENPTLELKLNRVLEHEMQAQPDAVYAFVRTRLNEGVEDRWLARLHQSAQRSLAVAIACDDPATIASWLQLLSREPMRYGLGEILHAGIVEALPYGYRHETLARDMLVIAIKREPSLLLRLLEDSQFTQALPKLVIDALFVNSPEAVLALATQSRELFLLSVARLMDVTVPLSVPLVEALWDSYVTKPNLVIAESYRAVTLIKEAFKNVRLCLTDESAFHLLILILSHMDDELFYQVAVTLAQQDALLPLLNDVLLNSGRTNDDQLTLVSAMMNYGTLTPQNTVNTLATLLDSHNWDKSTRPLAEHLTRLLAQNSEVKLASGVLWRILEFFDDPKHEALAKNASKRLLYEIASTDNEAELVKDLQRLRKITQVHTGIKTQILTWWREYTRRQTTVQLQKIERALETNRSTDDLRAILNTTISVRRLFGHKTLEEWAQEVSLAFRLLQAMSDGFDSEKNVIDVMTVRSELEAHLSELQPDVRQVLATNLKQLAQLIAEMADNRTKPSLIKSDEALERQLSSGELVPQSAIDLMKWFSGYLDGSQKG